MARDPFFEFFDKDRPLADSTDLPENEVFWKEYPRAPRVLFPQPSDLSSVTLQDAILYRKTERNFSSRSIDLGALGALLYWSLGEIHTKDVFVPGRRSYPSGGSYYPVESYIIILRGKDVGKGAYHYNPRGHFLEHIWTASTENIRQSLNYDFAKEAAAILFFSLIIKRSSKKYGNLAYKLGTLEAGHMAQNVYLVGAALGLGICAIGGTAENYEAAQKELDLDGEVESVFYQMAIGWPMN